MSLATPPAPLPAPLGRTVPSVPLAQHVNHTPFPSQYYQAVDQHGQVFHVIALRVTYDMTQFVSPSPKPNTSTSNPASTSTVSPTSAPTLAYAKEQTPLCEQDVWSGEVNVSSPVWESDFAPYKPKCDVLVVNAVSRPPMSDWHQAVSRNLNPDQVPSAKRWGCAVSLSWQDDTGKAQQWCKSIGVCGPRRFGLMSLADPEPASQVAIDWQRAYGGEFKNPAHDQHHADGSLKTAAGAKQWDTYHANPVGCGFDRSTGKAGPQLEVSATHTYRANSVQYNYPAVGLSAIGKGWLPRRSLAGTYDDAWLKTQWPLPPLDHDYAYWNCAPQDQQIQHPHSHIAITLAHLYGAHQPYPSSPKQEVWAGNLPSSVPTVLAYYSDIPGRGDVEAMDLDTLTIDLAAQTIACTYRYTTPAFSNPHFVLLNDMAQT
jgi:hypothetical protein